MSSLGRICPEVLEKILEIVNAFFFNYFVIISPLRRGWWCFCKVWLKMPQWFWWRRLLKNFYNVFFYFAIFSPLRRAWPFTWGYFVPSLVEIGPVVLEKKIFKVANLFLLFPNYLPFGKDVALHLSKIESPSPRNTCVKFGWKWPSVSGEINFHWVKCII